MTSPSPGPTSPGIAVHNLTVRYGTLTALDDVTLDVAPGAVCGLIGINGSGKSTLMKSITGLIQPTFGQMRLLGLPPAKVRRTGRLAYVAQYDGIDRRFPLDVRDVVCMGRYSHVGGQRQLDSTDADIVRNSLERVAMDHLAERPIGELSGGQRKRVFVARALAQQAPVVLLDEPFAGVDITTQHVITDVLRQVADGGASVLVATHDLQALPDLADEAILLRRRVIAHGTVEEIKQPEVLSGAFGLPVPDDVAATTPSTTSQHEEGDRR